MQIIILAAGKGSRMKSDLPKVMHEVHGKPMLTSVVENCSAICNELTIVYSDILRPYLHLYENSCDFVLQEQQLGTAHAVWAAKSKFKNDVPIGVIYGDNPLITPEIIANLFKHLTDNKSAAVTLAFEYDRQNAYGKIITDEQGNFTKIVESKFANDEEKQVTLCNSGVMAFAPGILEKYIDLCLKTDKNIPQKELYLTDIIRICQEHGEKVSYHKVENHKLVIGINTQKELNEVNN